LVIFVAIKSIAQDTKNAFSGFKTNE